MSDLTNVLLKEWSKIPMNTLLNLKESLPKRVEAVVTATGGTALYLMSLEMSLKFHTGVMADKQILLVI